MELKIVAPDFGSNLTEVIMELNHLRRRELNGSTSPHIFFQLKEIFHIFESVGSARIEGNRTTIAEYVEKKIELKIDQSSKQDESMDEISNVEKAMDFIEESIQSGGTITSKFLRELHYLVVNGLSVDREGDTNPYLSLSVQPAGSRP